VGIVSEGVSARGSSLPSTPQVTSMPVRNSSTTATLSHSKAEARASGMPAAETTFFTAVLQPSRVGLTTQGKPISVSIRFTIPSRPPPSQVRRSTATVFGTSIPLMARTLRDVYLSIPRAEPRTPEPL